MSDWGNGITRITLTDGTQRSSKRAGISYDYMDKLNGYVKAGIFVDKDNDGFTKAEQKALGAEFEKLHTQRGDKIDFRKMVAGKSFDYKNEEFIRLANAAGYVLVEDVKPQENLTVKQVEKVNHEKPVSVQEKSDAGKVETKVSEVKPDEITSLAQELEEMKKGWTQEELAHPEETLRNMQYKLQSEINELRRPYTMEKVTKHPFLRRAKTEIVKTPKSQEQLEADKLIAREKYEQLDKLAKLSAVSILYSSIRPSKYAGGRGDKFLDSVVTTQDGRKLGAARVKKPVYDELYGRDVETWVLEYYPISLRNYNEGKENEFPQYYYRVAEDAKPVEGEVKLAEPKSNR